MWWLGGPGFATGTYLLSGPEAFAVSMCTENVNGGVTVCDGSTTDCVTRQRLLPCGRKTVRDRQKAV